MADIVIKAGDDAAAFEFVPDAGVDFSGASAVFFMKEKYGGLLINGAAATIFTGSPSTYFSYSPQSGETPEGHFSGWFRITFAGGEVLSYPGDGHMDIRIDP